jgi:hypothetical protein
LRFGVRWKVSAENLRLGWRLTQGARLRIGEPHTARLKPAGVARPAFLFSLWLARQSVFDFQAHAFEASPVDPAAQIWRPTAVQTFFDGPEGSCT